MENREKLSLLKQQLPCLDQVCDEKKKKTIRLGLMNTAKAKMPQSYRNASRDWELAERRLIETKALFAELETIVAEEDRQNYRDQKRSESKRISDSLLEKGSVLR